MSPSGAASGRFGWVIIAAVLLVSSFVLIACSAIVGTPPPATETPIPPDSGNINVVVKGADGTPLIAGVVVRVTGSILSDGEDNDVLRLDTCIPGQFIAAWAPGYQANFVPCDGTTTEYPIQLQPLQNIQDNLNYPWLSAYANCGPCHAGQLGSGYNEISEWESSAHAKVFTSRYFETVYRGTDISGVSGPATDWVFINGKLVRQPKPNAADYKGQGFQLDYPGQAGNCAFCHAPAAVLPTRTGVDLAPLFFVNGDVRQEGITCDVCHKVNDVILADDKYPFDDKPGILSFQLLRLDGFTTGPFSNIILPNLTLVSNTRSMCAKIFGSSDFCAACHYGKFGDTLIYGSYKEWKESPYSKKPGSENYRTCQDCHMSHMQAGNNTPYARRKACSETADGFQDFSHNMMDFGLDDKLQRNIPRMIRGAASLDASFTYEPEKNNWLKARVFVENIKVGHKFPTDSPMRQLILVLDAKDQFGNSLLQVDGEQIPNWGGVNNPYMESNGVRGYAGLPGKIFANLLVESETNISPTTAYWNETKPAYVNNKDGLTSDTRLLPKGMDNARNLSDYYFAVPDDGEVRFTISLIYRFGFYDLMQQKRWVELQERRDIPVVVITCSGNIANANKIKCAQTDP